MITRRAFLRSSCALASLAAPVLARANPGDAPPILRTRHSQFTLLQPLRRVPSLPIARADGASIDFASLRGKALLVNFWATWCPPCAAEMPALDRLQRDLGGAAFEAAAISIERDGEAIGPFFRDRHIRHLKPFFDGAARIARTGTGDPAPAPFALYGLPISYMVDGEGTIRGYITGAVDWDSADARALCRYYASKAQSR